MIFPKSAVCALALLFATTATYEGGGRGGLAAATEPFQHRQRRFNKASKKDSKKNPSTPMLQVPSPTTVPQDPPTPSPVTPPTPPPSGMPTPAPFDASALGGMSGIAAPFPTVETVANFNLLLSFKTDLILLGGSLRRQLQTSDEDFNGCRYQPRSEQIVASSPECTKYFPSTEGAFCYRFELFITQQDPPNETLCPINAAIERIIDAANNGEYANGGTGNILDAEVVRFVETAAPSSVTPPAPPPTTPAPSSSFHPTETFKPTWDRVCPGNEEKGICICESDCFNEADKAMFCDCAEGEQCCATVSQFPTSAPSITSPPSSSSPPTYSTKKTSPPTYDTKSNGSSSPTYYAKYGRGRQTRFLGTTFLGTPKRAKRSAKNIE